MILHCVRHGQTQANADGRIQGQADTPLSELGRRQCEAVARVLCPLPIEAIYSSPLARAVSSAQCLAKQLDLELRLDERLMEINAGIFQGLAWPEIESAHPTEARLWKSHEPEYRIPGGESRADVMRRAAAVFHDIRGSGYEQVIVVAHGGLLSAALKALLEIPPRRSPFALENASITSLAWDDDIKLLSLNQTSHLAELHTEGTEL